MKLCFLILSAPYKPWNQLLDNCSKKTWLNKMDPKHSFFSYTGKAGPPLVGRIHNSLIHTRLGLNFWRKNFDRIPKSFFRSENAIEVDIFDSWDLMTIKFLSALQIINETIEYDFLIKVNTTTFVNIPVLEKILLPRIGESYWGGAITKEKSFTAGWATIVSKDVANKVVLEAVKVGKLSLPPKFEDEALGILLSKLDLRPEAVAFQEIFDQTDIKDSSRSEIPFFRIKANGNRQSVEPILFRALNERLAYA